MIKGDLVGHMERLLADRTPFVTATVVRAAKPTSVRPGDSALVLGDGTIDGFVGGVCAQASVRLHAARVLETGEAVLLRLIPGAGPGEDAGDQDGIIVAHNPCLSGGSLEIFLEPHIAPPRIVVAGDTPIARALETVARAAGYEVARAAARDVAPQASDAALIVASHGDDEELALQRALELGVAYVGLVASTRRGHVVRDSLDVDDALRAEVHTPAGLDIGARAPADVAIAILAELVAERTAHPPIGAPPPPQVAIDPVCGMEVAVSDASISLDVDGERFYFCRDACRATYAASVAATWVTGLVLAAGGSRRLGRPKQLLPYAGATLLGHTLGTARACEFDQLLCVLGGASESVRDAVDLAGAEVVVNEAFGEGCSSSIAAALGAVDERSDVLVLMLGDQPGVRPVTVAALLDGRGDAPLAACRYDDGRGHPLAFARSVFGDLRALHGDKGVWKLLDRRAADVVDVPVPGTVPLDVDTWEDYEAVLSASS